MRFLPEHKRKIDNIPEQSMSNNLLVISIFVRSMATKFAEGVSHNLFAISIFVRSKATKFAEDVSHNLFAISIFVRSKATKFAEDVSRNLFATFFFVTILVLLQLPLKAQIRNTSVEFDKYVYNFGKINESSGRVSAVFTLKNVGKEPLHIQTINVTCGCTVPQWDKSPVMPGMTSKITIAFDPQHRPGPIDNSVNIVANVTGGTVKLMLKGEVIPRPRTVAEDFPVKIAAGLCVSGADVNMGNIPLGKISHTSFPIANGGDRPVKVDVKGDNLPDYITLIPGKQILQPGERDEITVRFDAAKSMTRGTEKFGFHLIVNGVFQPVLMNVNAVLVDNYEGLTPEQFKKLPYSEYSSYLYHFSSLKKGAEAECEIYVTNSGEEDLIIHKLEFNSGAITAMCYNRIVKQGDIATIAVKLKRTNTPGEVSETLRVVTNDPLAPVCDIGIMATILP